MESRISKEEAKVTKMIQEYYRGLWTLEEVAEAVDNYGLNVTEDELEEALNDIMQAVPGSDASDIGIESVETYLEEVA